MDPRGAIVPWNDVLHEGPVPAGLGPTALREHRAAFLASAGANGYEAIARDFAARDRALDEALAPSSRIDEIVLWFEHDLFDQLHLIQILDRVPPDGGPRITAVQPRTYLGYLAAGDYPALFAGRMVVSSAERLAARDGWQAFRSPDPRAIVEAIPRVTALRHLAPALRRHLEQFPSTFNGLSRTEHETLRAVAAGASDLRDAFLRTNDREEAFFMGDTGFFFHVSSLFDGNAPLVAMTEGNRLQLTPSGQRALEGEFDRVATNGIDRWLGGVHLSGHGPLWRWDNERQTVRFV